MLKREENQPEQAAGEVRVKKEEMARAITILEARRQTEAQAREGTVVIGDVLQQLQINVPAEDVLHEIEALRDGQPQEEVLERPVDPLRTAEAKLIGGIILAPLAAIVLGGLIFHPVSPTQPGVSSYPPYSSVSSSYPMPPPAPFIMPPPLRKVKGVTGQMMDEGGFNVSSVLKPLSAVPNDQPVHCTSDSLRQLLSTEVQRQKDQSHHAELQFYAASLANSNQEFDVRPGLKKPWAIIKHDSNLYVRGWVAAKFTKAQAEDHSVVLHADPHSFDAGVTPQEITLKADFSPIYDLFSGMGSPARLTVLSAAPDSYAWEKW